MRSGIVRKGITTTLLLLSFGLLVVGAARTHKVYEAGAEEEAKLFGIQPPHVTISDADLVVDSTFSGTVRKGERLYSTYDRFAPRGKRACPT